MKYPNLFSPITLGNITFRNRMFAAPTGNPPIAPPTYLSSECTAFYENRARGGVASVCLGDGMVHTPTGLAHPHKLRFDDPAVVPSLANTARAIRQHGAVPTVEFSHAGKYANMPNLVSKNTSTGLPPYGPDHEITADGIEIYEMPREIIYEIVRSYGEAAKVAKLCGFGMICIHGGHGWLLQQFMSPKTNHRRDEFGGCLENRMRFALMAVDAVREVVGPGFPIEFRFSGSEFTDGGYDLEEGVKIAKLLAPKVDLLHVSAGVHDDPNGCVITHPSMFDPHGRNVFLAARIKQEVDCPVATVGALNDPAQMEEIIASGKADVVEMSRSLLADPFLPMKAAAGRESEIVQCIRCFNCIHQSAAQRNTRCTVNPVIGREYEHKFDMPVVKKPKKVLVVGGGPAGMEAALIAAQRGHDVTLCDEHESLGGQLLCEAHISFKRELFENVGQKAREMEKAGVKVLLNTHVSRQWAENFAADAIVCAAGAAVKKPPIPGIDLPIVKDIDDLRSADLQLGKRVVVMGAGLVGCESAIHFLREGHEVTVVGRNKDFAPDAYYWHRQAIRRELEKGVELRLAGVVTEICGDGVIVEHNGQREKIPADSVFCALGLSPRLDVRNELRYIAPEYYEIGDCLQPGTVFEALSQGHYIGRDI